MDSLLYLFCCGLKLQVFDLFLDRSDLTIKPALLLFDLKKIIGERSGFLKFGRLRVTQVEDYIVLCEFLPLQTAARVGKQGVYRLLAVFLSIFSGI